MRTAHITVPSPGLGASAGPQARLAPGLCLPNPAALALAGPYLPRGVSPTAVSSGACGLGCRVMRGAGLGLVTRSGVRLRDHLGT